jgi:AcrR family transcriptional regulator
MSKIAPETHSRGGRRRADAERNTAAILDAALALLGDHPTASMTEIAKSAGVTRQTVYAHFDSRESLLEAVAERALGRTLAAIDAAEPEKGPPEEALARLVDAWWGEVSPHARVLEALAGGYPDSAAIHDFHEPILERVTRLIARGRRAGDFDRELPAAWLAAAFLGLMHTAADEVAAGRIDASDAGAALGRSVPRLFGV